MRKYIVLLITVFIIPLILSAASNEVYVDGKKLNPDVVIKNDRNPVITWTYEDPKYTKASIIKVTVNVSTDSDFTPLFSSFTGPAAKNNYRLLYSSIAAPLKEKTTYYLRIDVTNAADNYIGWSTVAKFTTVFPEIDIDDDKIELKIDWNNPFYGDSYTKIRYSIPEGVDKEVFLGIYTLSGRLVRVLADNDIEISEVIHTKKWNGRDDDGAMVGSGTYLVHLRAGDKYKTVKVCFIR